MNILLSWVGFVAALAFLCFTLLYSATEAHVLPMEFILGLPSNGSSVSGVSLGNKLLALLFDGLCLVVQHVPFCAGGGWQGQSIWPGNKKWLGKTKFSDQPEILSKSCHKILIFY